MKALHLAFTPAGEGKQAKDMIKRSAVLDDYQEKVNHVELNLLNSKE